MKRFSILPFLVLVFAVNIFPQSNYTVKGVVKDTNGAVITGAQVELRGAVNQTSKSDSNGSFFFANIARGAYELKISANGFEAHKETLNVLTSLQTLEIRLEVGAPQVSVTAEIGRRIERENLPQAINLIGEKEIIERTNPILAQAATEEAGVNLQRTSPTMGGIFVRGLVGAKVNVYVDGVRYTTSAMRGGVSTFFNLNEPSGLQSIEILRGSNSAQYGSDALGGTVSLLSKTPAFGDKSRELHGDIIASYSYADQGFSGSSTVSYGTNRLGGYLNLAARRSGDLRVAKGLDSHAAVTRFLGLRSDILGERLPDTSFDQFGGNFRFNYSPAKDSQLTFNYARSQQDNGKRYDQLLGGDGNLIADLRNLMLDFGYIRYTKQNFGWFDVASFTVSYNSQREERVNQGGQGDPFGTITHQYERTSATGFSGFLSKDFRANSIQIGGDIYGEKVVAPAFTVNPKTNMATLSRPRVPGNSRYALAGVFVQDSWHALSDRLRIAGAIRYNLANYKVSASDSPIVGGFRLWNDDSLNVGDFSGRIGAVVRIATGTRLAFNYSRGFRAPSITDLGTLGLTGDGFEADYFSAKSLGGMIGTTADAVAVSTGLSVQKQRSEITNNYDASFRYGNKRFETEGTVFLIDFSDAITKQTLILPAGSTGKFIGDQLITSQNANGAIFVSLSTSPVLVRANYTRAQIFGFEYEAEAHITKEIKFTGNYTYIYAKDRATGLPPNIEGGTPPPTAFAGFKYEPLGKPFWIEAYATLASRQDRLSSLDISDRRTGATRSRSQIQNFFRRGACVRGLTNNPDGVCGTGDETLLLSTNETILQVQNRLLGGATSAPLFSYLPGYAVANLRGGIRFGEKSSITWNFENILDHQYRNPSWGIDGAGRSIRVGYRFKF